MIAEHGLINAIGRWGTTYMYDVCFDKYYIVSYFLRAAFSPGE
jgi:hypothetical protein